MATTLKDIAKILGLSEATVSRALNNNPKISLKTREMVQKVARENNFIKNTNAMKLATKKSYHIGIIFPDDFYEFNKRDFHSYLEKYFLLNSEKTNYEILIVRTNSLESTIRSGNVDGLIIANRDIQMKDIEILEKNKSPYVFVAYKPAALKDKEVFVFKSNNINLGYKVGEYLTNKGCQKILTITSNNEKLKDYQDRTKGFLNYLRENNLEMSNQSVYECNMTFEDGRDLILKNKKLLESFDGIFCQQDKVALGIISEAKNMGISIPEDIKIIGHDDMELIDYFYPRLTSIKQDFNKITLEALNHLINIIEKREEDNQSEYNFESEIIERETT